MQDQDQQSQEQASSKKETPLYDSSKASFELTISVRPGNDDQTMTFDVEMNPPEDKLKTKVQWDSFFKNAFVTPKPGTYSMKQGPDGTLIHSSVSHSEEELGRLNYVFGEFLRNSLAVIADNALSLPSQEKVDVLACGIIAQACTEILSQDPPQMLRSGFLDVRSEPSGKYFEPGNPAQAVTEAARVSEEGQPTNFALCIRLGSSDEGRLALLPAKDCRVTVLVEVIPSYQFFAKYLNDLFVQALKASIARQERTEVRAYRDYICESIIVQRRCVEQMNRSFELPPFVASHND